jgi:hypothetical protein
MILLEFEGARSGGARGTGCVGAAGLRALDWISLDTPAYSQTKSGYFPLQSLVQP